MAAAAAAVSAIGAITSTIGKTQAADVQAKALDRQAESIDDTTNLQVQQQNRRNRLLQGQANATAAASGLSLTSGTPLLMELDRAKQGAIESQSIRRQGTMDANTARFNSRMTRRQIPFDIIGGISGGGGSILSQYMMAK